MKVAVLYLRAASAKAKKMAQKTVDPTCAVLADRYSHMTSYRDCLAPEL